MERFEGWMAFGLSCFLVQILFWIDESVYFGTQILVLRAVCITAWLVFFYVLFHIVRQNVLQIGMAVGSIPGMLSFVAQTCIRGTS